MNGYQYLRSCDMFGPMKSWSMISRLFVVLAVFGLVVGPVAASSTVPAMVAQAMASMPDGMPCSPDDQPAAPDCAKDCPLAMLCVPSLVSVPIAEAPSFLVRVPIGDELFNGKEVFLSSLVGGPPPRPPKA